MAGLLTIRFDFLGEKQISRKLGVLADQVKDLSGAWPKIHDYLSETTAKQFRAEGAGPRGKWEALSDNPTGKGYASRKAIAFPGAPILVRTGAMKRSLLEADDPWHVFRRAALSMEFGTRMNRRGAPYPRFHQSGTSKMPQRPVFDLAEGQKRHLTTLIARHIHRTLDIRDVRAPRVGRRSAG